MIGTLRVNPDSAQAALPMLDHAASSSRCLCSSSKRAIAKASSKMQVPAAYKLPNQRLQMRKLILGLSLAGLLGSVDTSFAQQDDGQQNGAGAVFGAVLGGLVGGVVGAAASGHAPRARDVVSGVAGGDRGKAKSGGAHAGEHAGGAKGAPVRRKPGK